MTQLELTVNGRMVSTDVEPRTHLADFLRETLLLTGTHLGCEHGVCGACTVLLDNQPVRSCITYAAFCHGTEVRSIEGLDDDPVTTALRSAFTAEHALQCGYCTPGMLVTARDIVLRLPQADDDRIRLELAGNLCRCTGYNGIVKAIRSVLYSDVAEPVAAPEAVAKAVPIEVVAVVHNQADLVPAVARTNQSTGMSQSMRIGLPADIVWTAIQDPALVAGCVPGARLTAREGDRIEGEMLTSLGPIQARFAGHANLVFHQASRGGRLVGEGQDRGGGTRLSGEATFVVVPDGPGAALIRIDMTYALRGPLAQFGRGPVVQVFASELAAATARNLEASLRGGDPAAGFKPLRAGRLFVRVAWHTVREWFRQRRA